MVKRRKGFSASHSKATSRRLQSATLGTHVPSTKQRSSRHVNADQVGFSNTRKNQRAARGVVQNVASHAQAGAGRVRVSQREFARETRRRARVRHIGFIVIALVALLAIAGGVGGFTYYTSLESQLSLKDSDAKSALVSSGENEPYYTLVCADVTDARVANAEKSYVLALVRTDEQNKRATIVSIPSNLRVTLTDGNQHRIIEAYEQSGDAALISAVSSFAGVSISHYVKTDAAGISRMVSDLGDLTVQVNEEIDDPRAGADFIPAGQQILGSDAVLTLLRANNFQDAPERMAQNQQAVLSAFSLALIDKDALSLCQFIDASDGAFGCDVSLLAVLSMADALRGMSQSEIYSAMVPGYELEQDGVVYYRASSDAWASMMELVTAGENPLVEDLPTAAAPDSFTLTVRNGAGITGAAAQISESLIDRGFDVVDVGNTDTAVYTETLVIYKDDEFAAAAQSVSEALGLGRLVQDVSFYQFDSDVLLILGSDWKPAA